MSMYSNKSVNKSHLGSLCQQTGHYITFPFLEPVRTVSSVLRVHHVAGPLLNGVISARPAARGPRRPGRVVALDRLRRVAGAGTPRGIRIVPGRVTVDEAAFQLAELPRTAVSTVRRVDQNGSTLHAVAFAACDIAGTSLPMGSLAVLLKVRRVFGIDDRLIADRNVRKLSIFATSVQTVFPGHEVVIISATAGEEQNRTVILVAVEVPPSLRIPAVARLRFQEAQFGNSIQSVARR